MVNMDTHQGLYRAIVRQRTDPLRLQRVKVEVVGVHKDKEDVKLLPWAFPASSPAWKEGGGFNVPPVDAMVWVMFEGGNHEYPLYIGGWWGLDEDRAEGKDLSAHKRWPTSVYGSQKKYIGGLLKFEDLPELKPEDAPNNFGFISPMQQRVEFDARAGRNRVVLADQIDNGLYLNTEDGVLSLETWASLTSPTKVAQRGITFSSNVTDNILATQVFSAAGWKITISDSDSILELVTPIGHILRFSDQDRKVELWSSRGNRVVLDDAAERIELRTPLNRGLILDDSSGFVSFHSPNTGMHLTLNDQTKEVQLRSTGDLSCVADGNLYLKAGGSIILDGQVVAHNPGIATSNTIFSAEMGSSKFSLPTGLPFLKTAHAYDRFKDLEKA